ncbi:MAG: metallophosphoesterase family protein [Verrucomicrobiota bacterium JB023]|nr:metallophosphoesterase family protein [Verrucomicrobiota bacterium JB023]
MRIALFADIHANLEALETVLADAAEQGCTDYVCLGDIVGYNANPSECLERVRALDCPVVKGNHDEDCGGDHSLDAMNPTAAEALRWTREQLSEEQREYLRTLRMVRQVEDFTIVHSSLDQPQVWNYVSNKFDAMSSFSYQFTRVCFHGHTHVPRVFARDTSVKELSAESVQFEDNLKYFVNVGSVGQPRNGDWRACYAIYDIPSNTLVFRRLEYDILTTQEKIRQAGLPDMLATRLAEGR